MALEIRGLEKKFGGVVALAGVDVDVRLDEVLGIVGPNGSGKTTLFNIVTGTLPPDGRAHHAGRATTSPASRPPTIARQGIARSFQQAMTFAGVSVLENVQTAWEHGGPSPARHERRLEALAPRSFCPFVGLGEPRRHAIAGDRCPSATCAASASRSRSPPTRRAAPARRARGRAQRHRDRGARWS